MKKLILYVAMGVLLSAGCTERLYKKGVRNYDKMAYSKAIGNFEDYLSKREKADAAIKLADSYRLMNDIPNAEKWYSQVVEMPEAPAISMYYYARILMTQEKYDDAKIWLKKYLLKVPNDVVAEMLLVSCNTIKSFKIDTTLYSLKEIEMPEVESAFAQTPYQSGIMFTADKMVFKKSDKSPWTGKSYLGIYFSKKDRNGKWLNPMTLKGDMNGQYHEGPACFSKDGNVVYFTRSNFKGKKLKVDDTHTNNLKIYKAELVGEEWTNLVELPFNSDNYSCGHPALSFDEKTLYFISDMPGGLGGTDIYKSTLDSTGWSKPENLGTPVNTPGNEMFPYSHYDGTFYFSSDAHNNLGGLDVFMTYYDGKKWLQVENLNSPLNSSADDFAYVLNKDNKTGYVSSNRYGDDKMFEVTKNDPTFILSGVVLHRGKSLGIDSAVVEVYNKTANVKEKIYSGKNGLYRIRLRPNSQYTVKASKPMFFQRTSPITVSSMGKKVSESFTANFELEAMIVEKPIVLNNIYYDLDKWEIKPEAMIELDKLAEVLVENPRVNIELSSHTDSRAGDEYNLVLSDKRAKAAVHYLVEHKGIDAKRLKWKGYGEKMLLNKCSNNVPCTEEEHQLNRRTEFKVLKSSNMMSVL
ncbi:MAG: OmpA family protein [bacterium]|nr:OmpA family protein [bacterium]